MSENARVRRAIHAASDIVRRLGAGTTAPVLLNDSNNISIRLAPLPIVARVVSGADDASVAARTARELEVCRHLVASDMPEKRAAADDHLDWLEEQRSRTIRQCTRIGGNLA